MSRKQLQHMIEEPDPGRDHVTPATFNRQPQVYFCLRRLAIDACYPLFRHAESPVHSISLRLSSIACTPRCICSRVAIVIRTQPSHPGSADRSRTSTPRPRMARQNSAWSGPMYVKTKFASEDQYRTP